MKLVKFTVFAFVILSSISAGIIYFAFSHVDDDIAEVIEAAGSDITQTQVKVDRVDINLIQGSGALYSLSIANPEGYSSNTLFVSSKIAFNVDASTFNQAVKVINKVSASDIYFFIEQNNENNNIQTVANNINQANTPQLTEVGNVEEGNGQSIKLMIERITFDEMTLDLRAQGVGLSTITVPSFFIENIGSKERGLTPKEAGQEITRQLMAKANAAAKEEFSRLLPDALKEKAQSALGNPLQQTIPANLLPAHIQ